MNHMLKKAGLALAMSATALTVAAPADAQRYRGYRHNDNTGTAIIAGIAGLAIGAAIVAGSNNNDRYRNRGYTDGGQYRDGYAYQQGAYRGGRYDDYRRGYDDRGRNYGGYGYQGQQAYGGCYIEQRYDRYSRRSVAVRVCN